MPRSYVHLRIRIHISIFIRAIRDHRHFCPPLLPSSSKHNRPGKPGKHTFRARKYAFRWFYVKRIMTSKTFIENGIEILVMCQRECVWAGCYKDCNLRRRIWSCHSVWHYMPFPHSLVSFLVLRSFQFFSFLFFLFSRSFTCCLRIEIRIECDCVCR